MFICLQNKIQRILQFTVEVGTRIAKVSRGVEKEKRIENLAIEIFIRYKHIRNYINRNVLRRTSKLQNGLDGSIQLD